MQSTIRQPDREQRPRSADMARIRALEHRLDEGFGRIEQALRRGDDVERWESFWIDLLHEYEALHDDLIEAA